MRNETELFVHLQLETIYVPDGMWDKLLHWYHDCLQHPAIQLMQATVKEYLYWPKIDQDIATYVKNCTACQSYKITAVKKYGKIPLPRSLTIKLWEEVHVDMIGPWTVHFELSDQPGKNMVQQLQALTIIDKGTGWPEFIAT
jgi:hypothetical protein